MSETTAESGAREKLLRRGVMLEVFTIAWNVIEAVIAVGAGIVSNSVALIGFGLDSLIEVAAAVALFRRLRAELKGQEPSEAAERKALRVVAITFFILAAYVLYEAGSALFTNEHSEKSMVGIVLSAVSLVIMPFLGFAKLRTGRALKSKALIADSVETFVCCYLSAALLLGLGLNAALGWWWADPVAAFLMLPLIVKEGWEAWEEANEEGECDDHCDDDKGKAPESPR